MKERGRWRLRADGRQLDGADGEARRLDRRTAALVAYLALEGATTRSRLCGLLYPEANEVTARNNLAQLLRRFERLGGAYVAQGDTVRLGDIVTVEATPDLLSGVDVGDLPDLEDWLLARRERARDERKASLALDASRHEEQGDLDAAVRTARALMALDPLSEEAARRLMRLLYLVGQVSDALRTYTDLETTLRNELRTRPLPETRQLALDIERGVTAAPPLETRSRRIPRAVLHPPVLVGRDEALTAMNEAWAHGQGVILTGEPGVGKTRLIQEFLATHGGGAHFQGRPGDATLLYGTHARTFRQVLRDFPNLHLEPWTRSELARILPELGEAPPPIRGEQEKLRFWQAKTEVMRAAIDAGLSAMVFDDCQFMDLASIEAGHFIFAALGWGDSNAKYRTVHAFRRGSLLPPVQAALDHAVAIGQVALVELAPLRDEDVARLAAQLELPRGERDVTRLVKASGGNPLFVLEAARSLHEVGTDVSESVPLTPVVSAVIGERLARLSPPALLAARAAAVLQSDFDADLIADVLGAPVLHVAAAWEELEAAQVLAGERFAHDLVFETITASMPSTVGRLLHRGAARALETRAAPAPGRVARHWQEGGDVKRAAPWLFTAGEAAAHALRPFEAGAWFDAAREAFEHLGDEAGARRAAEAHARVSA
ncbi:BTAD domain-containing putative transcriptional regulator [Deinococcus yavapaiensis]|uniref:AAA ATPase-like protein n=1 Tax=Deinococcus yavapaiensis KR-236 TaxID=694435 RepID=A0A318S209_9DEIO|nr:BTAD domain-containing putative transcriptional regulator [Deinococcus yavapaiensis]PYE49399.1 AAA ATPase-like protein [Deinococcus yavapaiensis KR-236]